MIQPIIYPLADDAIRTEFLESIAEDLRLLGHEATIRHTGERAQFECKLLDFSEADVGTRRAALLAARNRNLQEEVETILELERRGLLDYMIPGDDLDIEAIQPEVRIVDPRSDVPGYYPKSRGLAIVDYYSRMQSAPYSKGAFRRFHVLVFDMGQRRETLMGIISLSSPAYSLHARDNHFGWYNTGERIPNEVNAIKKQGLKRIAQLSVYMALEPYAHLHTSKLLATLALSDPIQTEFRVRYNDPLLAVVTTAVFGPDAQAINDIRTPRIMGSSDYNGRLYRQVGTTSEYSTLVISPRSHNLAKMVIAGTRDPDNLTEIGRLSSAQRIQRALAICGLSRQVMRMYDKGIWVGVLSNRNLDILRGNSDVDTALTAFAVENIVAHWKRYILPKALDGGTAPSEVTSFDPTRAALSNVLDPDDKDS